MFIGGSVLLVFAIHVAATVADGKATERMPTMSPEAQDHSVTLHEKMAEVADQDRSDCLKLAADLRATIDALSPPVLGSDNLLGEIGRDADDLPDVAPEIGALDAAHFAKVDAARSRMQPILQSCAHNPELRVALRQLSLWPHRTTGGRLSV